VIPILATDVAAVSPTIDKLSSGSRDRFLLLKKED
jgi:hypothetical protein